MFSIKSVYITVPHNSHSTILCVLASMVYVALRQILCFIIFVYLDLYLSGCDTYCYSSYYATLTIVSKAISL